MTTATRNEHDITTERILLMAFERSEKSWKLGFTAGHGQKPRKRTVVPAAAACRSSAQQGVARLRAAWTDRARWGRGARQGVTGSRASLRPVSESWGGVSIPPLVTRAASLLTTSVLPPPCALLATD
jgi:hypothetical protein